MMLPVDEPIATTTDMMTQQCGPLIRIYIAM